MNITEARLRANGWEETPGGFSRNMRDFAITFHIWFDDDDREHVSIQPSGEFMRLPNIRTMEQLALLFALLGDKATVDDLTIPPALRADAGRLERAVGKEFGE